MASLYITENIYSNAHSITCYGLDLPDGSFQVVMMVETPYGVFIDNREKIDEVLALKDGFPEIKVRHIQF